MYVYLFLFILAYYLLDKVFQFWDLVYCGTEIFPQFRDFVRGTFKDFGTEIFEASELAYIYV